MNDITIQLAAFGPLTTERESPYSNPLPDARWLWEWLSDILGNDMIQAVTGNEETTNAIERAREEMNRLGLGYLLDEVSQSLQDFLDDQADEAEENQTYSLATTDELRAMLAEYWSEQGEREAEVKH